MVLPPCPMAEFVVSQHSAVMERLRRRIELCRRHHSACESRYQAVSPERLELERQQTFALHQRCLQAKAKRAGKHRQPPLPPPTAPPPTAPSHPPSSAPGPGPGASASTSTSSDRPGVNGLDSDTAGGEQQQHGRSSALIAQLHETVKRKLDNSVSPQNGDQPNGFGDIFPVPKKLCHDDGLGGLSGSSNGIPPVSPLHQHDSKPSSGENVQLNGKHSISLDGMSKKDLPHSSLQLNGSSDADDSFAMIINKELKQEPDDLPCMITGPGSSISQNNLMSDLNLNDQEWEELMNELNRSMPDEDMKDLFTEDFEEKKEGDPSNSTAQTSLPQDIIIKTEFSPANFEQEQIGSPQVRSTSAGTFIGTSSVPVTAASPAVSNSQTMFQPSNQSMSENPNQSIMQPASQAQNVQRPLSNSLLSGQTTGSAKEMSSAKQLQQIAAKQKRDQLLQNQQQVHPANQISSWQQSGPSHSPLALPYSMDNPTSPSVYQQDFSNQKLLIPNMPNKSSPRTGGNYHGGNMLSHQPSNINQNSISNQNSVLDYGNTKPLSHYKECGQGITVPGQNKSSMLAYLQQHQQPTLPHMSDEQSGIFVMKKSGNIAYRPLVQHSQDQNHSAGVPRIPVSVPGNGVNAQPPNVSMAGNHGNAAYLNSQQQAAVMKQHQMLLDHKQQQKQLLIEQHKQFLMGQRQLLAEQEKQRHHQEQQLQRHLTRPPPQYQDQTQNTYQQQVGQFPGSSPSMTGVNNLGQSNSSSPRMFSQNQNMIQIGTGHNSVSSSSNQQDRAVNQYTGLQNIQRGNLYSMASGMTQMVQQHANPTANGQPQMQRQPSLAQGTALPAGYGQNTLGNSGISHQHNKGALNATLSKPQMARMPAIGAQNSSWQHQGISNMNNQAQRNNGLGTFTASSTFHMQQTHLKLSSQQFAQGMPQVSLNTSRTMAPMNSAVSGQILPSLGAQQRTNPPTQQPVQAQQVLPGMSQTVPDLTFSQNQNQQLSNRTSLHCTQGYPVRTASQELPFAYSNPSGGNGLQNLTGDTDLIDTLLKNRTSEEWMNDLDELLGNH